MQAWPAPDPAFSDSKAEQLVSEREPPLPRNGLRIRPPQLLQRIFAPTARSAEQPGRTTVDWGERVSVVGQGTMEQRSLDLQRRLVTPTPPQAMQTAIGEMASLVPLEVVAAVQHLGLSMHPGRQNDFCWGV